MKINFLPSISTSFTSFKTDIENMSGKKLTTNAAQKLIEQENINSKNHQTNMKKLVPAIAPLARSGYYNASVLLYNAVKSSIKEDDIPPEAYYYAGKSYMNVGDMKNANTVLTLAKDYTPIINGINSSNIYRNYYIAAINNNSDRIEEYEGRPTVLSALANNKKEELLTENNPAKTIQLIIDSYKKAQALGICDIDINLDMAKVYSALKEYEKSSEICRLNLDILQNSNKIYTKEFYDNLIVLGKNYMETATTNADFSEAVDILNNAKNISQNATFKNDNELLNYLLLKGYSQIYTPSDYIFQLEQYAQNTTDENLVKEAYLMSEKIDNYEYDADTRVEFLKKAEVIAQKKFPLNENELYYIYSRIIELNPALQNEYYQKIQSLENIDYSSLSNTAFINLLNINEAQNNTNGIEKLEKSLTQGSINDLIFKSHRYYNNILNGKNYENNSTSLISTLEKLYDKVFQEKEDSSRKELYKLYSNTGAQCYKAHEYNRAQLCAQRALSIAESLNLSDDELAQNHIQNVLISYKGHNYYSAENACLNYLKFLIKKESVSRIDVKNLAVSDFRYKYGSEIVNNMPESSIKNIASAIETLGLINLKKEDYKDAEMLFQLGIDLRNKIQDKDLKLANDYSAMARILIIRGITNGGLDSSEYHDKCLETLRNIRKNSIVENILKQEEEFHKKYYGVSLASAAKYLPFRSHKEIREKFKCYNGDLNICE